MFAIKECNPGPFGQQRIRSSAFTLIELLVVIAVIAVLMGMLMPALSRAREQGKRASCMSNLKQLMLAWNMYADENSEKVVFAGTNKSWETSRWGATSSKRHKCWTYFEPDSSLALRRAALHEGGLFPYVSEEKLFKCPTGVRGEVVTYAITDAMNGHRGHMDGIRTAIKRTDIKSPSSRMVFIDEGQLSPSSWTVFYNQPKWWDQVTMRHGFGTNVGIADGHVEYYKWSDARTRDVAEHQNWQSQGRQSAMATQPGNEDLMKVQRAVWGELGYTPK
ncbi:type II secretion system protein [Planctomycetota bacterium]